jgi:hypothetical protein
VVAKLLAPPFTILETATLLLNYLQRYGVALYAKKILSCDMARPLCGLVSEFLATDPEIRVRFPALPYFLRSSGSGTGSTQPREYN